MPKAGMTEKDMLDAETALINWFKSQDIKPSDGALIMLRTIATQITSRTHDLEELKEAINNASLVLTYEVALIVRIAKAGGS